MCVYCIYERERDVKIERVRKIDIERETWGERREIDIYTERESTRERARARESNSESQSEKERVRIKYRSPTESDLGANPI